MAAFTDTAWKGKADAKRNSIREKMKRVTTFRTNPRRVDGTLKANKPKPVSLPKVSLTENEIAALCGGKNAIKRLSIALALYCGLYGPRALPVPKPDAQIEQDVNGQKWCELYKSGGAICREER